MILKNWENNGAEEIGLVFPEIIHPSICGIPHPWAPIQYKDDILPV